LPQRALCALPDLVFTSGLIAQSTLLKLDHIESGAVVDCVCHDSICLR
jgi:hypothetical protein